MAVRNKELARKFASMPCRICGSFKMVSGHHLVSFKSRPDLDIENNLIALCFNHHREIHDKGMVKFIEKYNLKNEMLNRGFYLDEVYNKWRYPDRGEK